MKENDLFVHPTKNKLCKVTRYYGENAWYYKEAESDTEMRAKIAASKVQIAGLKDDQKAKINVHAIKASKWNFTEKFLNFIEENKNTVFEIDKINKEIVHLKNIPYTFWYGYINLL